MDQELMAKALQGVLGAGYESRARMSGHGVGQAKQSRSPRDFLPTVPPDDLVVKDAVGSDLHVPTTLGAPKKKAKGHLKAVEYVHGVSKAEPKKNREAQVGRTLTAMGATGGLLSLPGLTSHTRAKLRQAKEDAPAVGRLRALKNPKVGAGIAAGAAGLEVAGLAGDFVANHALRQPKPKTGVMKALGTAMDDGALLMETFSKVDSDKRQVFGWCSISKKDGVDVVDLQGDMIDIEEIETAAYRYMLNSRKGGNQHARVTKGLVTDEPLHVSDIIESVVFTPEKIEKMGLPADFPQGWWIGQQIHDEETWQQVKSGKRRGFSVHGKGRRELVEAEVGQEIGKAKYVPDRKEQVKDVTLGVSGATAAGSGATAAILPKVAEHKPNLIGAAKAEHLSGRLKIIGAVTGGAAGVYGGIHAAHQAARQVPLKPIERKLKRKVVAKAWSPVARQHSLEARRGKRGKAYEATATTGAVGSAGVAGGAHAVRRVSEKRGAAAGEAAAAVKVPQTTHLNARLKGAAQARQNNDAWAMKQFNRATPEQRAAQGLKPIDVKARIKQGEKQDSATRARFHAKRNEALGEQGGFRRVAAKEAGRAKVAGRIRTRSGVAALGLGAAAGLIHRERKGSWRSYPGTQ